MLFQTQALISGYYIFSGIKLMIGGGAQFQKIMDEGQTSMDYTSKDNQRRTQSLCKTKMLVVLLLLIMMAISALLLLDKQSISSTNIINLPFSLNGQQQFSKILWVQSETSLGQSRMVRQIINNNLIHFGREGGYQVRVLDNFNAYDWLSPSMVEFVRQVSQKSLFWIDVSQILRVALLYEHGGISIKDSCILNGKLDWVEGVFRIGQSIPGVQYLGKDKNPEIILFYKQKAEKRFYEDDVMIARRGSKLLQETLLEMSKFLINFEMKDVKVEYPLNGQSAQRESYNSLFIDLVNSKQNPNLFGVMSIDKGKGNFMMNYQSAENLKADILQDPKSFQLTNGKRHIIQGNFDGLSDMFLQLLQEKYSSLIKKNTILRSKIIDIGSNSWVTNQITETRQVHFCIISLKVLQKDYYQSVSKSVAALQSQTYSAWKAIYFTDGKQEDLLNFEKGEVLKSSGSQGVDLQQAATSHCDPRDVAILLNYDQRFERQDGLQTIAKVMIQRKYFGAFLSAKNQSSNINSTFASKEIKRQIGKVNPELFRDVADNFRVFRISSYRFIPQRTLHDNDGNYYDTEIVFLSLLEMGWGFESCEGKTEIAYHIKKIQENVDIPKYRAHIADVAILMTHSKPLNLSRPQYYLRYRSERMCDSMKQFHSKTHRSLEEFFAFNDDSNIQTNSKAEIIPKKVHTIIFGEEILNLKYRILKQSKKALLSYEHLIWEQANITRTNFPYTYDIIMALRKSNVVVRELAQHQQVIINLMRLQILYWHGGIYLDPHYLIINQQQLEKILVFEVVLPAMPFPNSYSVEMNSLIAIVQHYKPLLDLLDHRVLSSINFYSKDAAEHTGAIIFGRLLSNKGTSNTIFQSSVEYFQPDYRFTKKANQDQKKSCKTENNYGKTSFLGYVYDGDCRAKYRWALGVSL